MISKEAKILIVDDMKMIRSSVRKYLNSLGYENIIEARSGREAVDIYFLERPAMIFMDVVMPELSGNEALRKIRSHDIKVPIVMLTSISDRHLINECEELGISGYILKPLTMESGPQVIKDVLATVVTG